MTNYTAPLKFRAWDKKLAEWSEIFNAVDVDGVPGMVDWDGFNELENLIITQSTGLKDKNGKEIFGGDIVKILPGSYVAEIVFEDGLFLAKMDYDVKDFADYQLQRLEDLIQGGEVEVIGNVFENTELVEGEA